MGIESVSFLGTSEDILIGEIYPGTVKVDKKFEGTLMINTYHLSIDPI
jgi:hypothetical protein